VLAELSVTDPAPPDPPAANMRPPLPLPLITAVLLSVIENPEVAPMIVGPVPLFVIVPVMLVPVAVPTMAAPAIPVEFSVTAEDRIALVEFRFNLLGFAALDCAPTRLIVPPEMLPDTVVVLAVVAAESPMLTVEPVPNVSAPVSVKAVVAVDDMFSTLDAATVIGPVNVKVPVEVRVYPLTLKLSAVTVWLAPIVTVPAVPWKITVSADVATWSAALPVAAELKVVPHVVVPPTPFPKPATVSQ